MAFSLQFAHFVDGVFNFSCPSPFCPTWSSSLCVWDVASASVHFDAMTAFFPTWWRFPPVCSLCWWFFFFSRPSPFCSTWSSLCVWGVGSASDQFGLIWWRFLRLSGVFLKFAHFVDGLFTFSCPSPFCPTWSSLCVWVVNSANVQFELLWCHLFRLDGVFLQFVHSVYGVFSLSAAHLHSVQHDLHCVCEVSPLQASSSTLWRGCTYR